MRLGRWSGGDTRGQGAFCGFVRMRGDITRTMNFTMSPFATMETVALELAEDVSAFTYWYRVRRAGATTKRE